MQIKIDKFCGLAHSPTWQAWLYHFNSDLFSRFSNLLRSARGCSQNTDIMIDVLKEIDSVPDGSNKLLSFLRANYAYMLVDDTIVNKRQSDEIFGYYNPNILTYPRRLLINGTSDELLKKVNEFSINKLKVDYVIVDDKLYVEYLLESDNKILNQIPESNWKIAAFKLANNL